MKKKKWMSRKHGHKGAESAAIVTTKKPRPTSETISTDFVLL